MRVVNKGERIQAHKTNEKLKLNYLNFFFRDPMSLESISITNFRNLAKVRLELDPEV